MAILDITKTGAQPYQDIQDQNDLSGNQVTNWRDLPASQRMQYHQERRKETLPVEKVGYEQVQQWGDFGNSKYDVDVPLSSLNNLEAWRGENQSAGRQWLHGLGKGVGLAATTFFDGTLGLLYGIGQGVSEGRVSALWDNDLSNTLQDINQKMEEWLPNYRTQEEQERNWLQNAGTANFWADGFLKNLGFSVGAFYSGNAWLKGLKAMKWVKNAASAKAVGSLLSGFNEGRIEANNGQRDILNAQYKLIDDEREVMAQEIAANPYASDEVKIQKLKTLDDNVKIQKDKTLERAHQAGMAILIGNTLILPADNMWQFGKLYSRGFTNAKGIMGRIEDGMMKQGIRGGIKEGGKYVAETVSKPRAILRGFSNAAFEGFEELNQAAIAEGAGYWRGVDSPDAYYKALKDPKAQLQTKGFFEALGTGLTNTYGNRDRWEEFAIGFLTGAIGMPTFGSVINADANTWIGKNKKFGVSGGIVGEYRSQMQKSRENEESAKVMNAYLDKLATNANYFSQSQSFTNAMDGFAASNNKFEYENMSNNDDFAAISRFALAGRMDDLKELVNQDFENMSDEQLHDIAVNTTPNIIRRDDGSIDYEDVNGNVATGGWRDATGKLMSETPEGREKMGEDLKAKRDKILYEIDKYEKSVEAVRAISNNSLPEDQVNELAWLDWKGKMFNSRYSQVQKKQEENLTGMFNAAQKYSERAARDIETYNSMVNAVKFEIDAVSKDIKDTKATIETVRGNIRNSKDNQASALTAAAINMHRRHIASQEERLSKLQESYDNLKKDTNRENELEFGKYLQDIADEMTKFLGYIKSSDNPLQLASKIESNEEFIKWAEDGVMKELLTNEMGITGEGYDRIMQDLKDTAMIAKTAKQFKERYDEFSKNPAKLMANRSRIDKAKDKASEIINKQRTKKKVKDTPVSEWVESVSNGDVDIDDLAAKVEGTSAEGVVKEVKDIIGKKEEIKDEVSKSDIDGALKEVMNIAVDNASGESKEEVLAAINSFIQDPQSFREIGIDEGNIPQMIAELQEAVKDFSSLDVGADELSDLSTIRQSKKTVEPKTPQPQKDETGADAVKSNVSVQEQKKAQEEAKQEEANTNESIAERDGNKISDDIIEADESTGHVVYTEQEKEEIKEDAKTLLKQILDWYKEGRSYEDVSNDVSDLLDSDSFDLPESMDAPIFDYIDNLYGKSLDSSPTVQESTPTPIVETHQTTMEEAESYDNDIEKHIEESEQSEYKYYKPQQSLLPFRRARTKYDFTPYYDIIKIIVKGDEGKEELSPAERAIYNKYHGKFNHLTLSYKKHIVAVGEYLNKVGAFNYVDNGNVQKGDAIGFTVSKELNDAAGDVVVLMTKGSQVVGSMPSLKFDSYTIDKTPGLRAFLKQAINQWNKSGKIIAQSKVNKYMIGQLPFIDERHTLNEIYGDETFNLGISFNGGTEIIKSNPGVSANEELSDLEKHTMIPLSASKGQPFLLFETKDKSQRRNYIPIPFLMPVLNESTANSELGKAIRDRLESLPNYNNSTVMPVLNELKELLSLKELHINYMPDGKIKIDILQHGNTGQNTVFNQPAANIGSAFTSLLRFNVPFQVSRRYMNTTFAGKSYNRMIGELANINLGVGSTHTVSNWFTINPIGADGKMIEGVAPVTTMTNPDAHGSISINFGDSKYSVNLSQSRVYDNAGKEYTGSDRTEILAYAEGVKRGYNMQGKPYISKYAGENQLFNPVTRKFEDKPVTTNDVITSFNSGLDVPADELSDLQDLMGQKAYSTEALLDKLEDRDAYRYLKQLEAEEAKGTQESSRKGDKQIKKAIKLLAEARTIRDMAAAINMFDVNVYHGAEATEEEKTIFNNAKQRLANSGYEVINLLGTEYNEGMKVTADFVQDESLPKGTRRITGVKVPQINKDGVMVQSATIVVRENVSSEDQVANPTEQQIDDSEVDDNDLMALLNATMPKDESVESQPQASQDELEEKALDKGIVIKDTTQQGAWNALTPEQKSKLVGLRIGKADKVWERLVGSYNSYTGFDVTRLEGTVDDILDGKVKFRTMDEQKSEPFDLSKETAWLRKVLPQFSDAEHLQLVKGLTKIGTNTEVYGMFMRGIILLNSKTQTRGTTYHEAFHAVFDTLLTDDARNKVIEAGKQKFHKEGIALEEALAEDFRKYTQGIEYKDEGNILTRFWRKLASWIKRLSGHNRTLNKLYADINNGLYATRVPQVTDAIKMSEIDENRRLSDFIRIKESLSSMFDGRLDFSTMNIDYNSTMKDAASVRKAVENTVLRALPEAKVSVKVSDYTYYAKIDEIKINGYQLLDEIDRIDKAIAIRKDAEEYDRNRTEEQRLSEQALIDQGDTFDFNARYREIPEVNDVVDRLIRVNASLTNLSSRPKEFVKERALLTEERDNLRYQMRQLTRGMEHKEWISKFDHLSEQDQKALIDYGLTKETWEELNDEGRDNALLCFGAF